MSIVDNEIIFYKEEPAASITNLMIDKLLFIDKRDKILYFNYYFTEEELISKNNIFNNKNIIILDNPNIDIDKMEKYISYSKPKYVFIDYFKLTIGRKYHYIGNKKLSYISKKINEYSDKYNVVFVVAINNQ